MAEIRFVPPERRHAAALAIALAALVAGLAVASPQFLTLRNLVDIAQGAAFTGILAAGLLIVLVSGGIDISFAAVASIAQYGLAAALARIEGGWLLAFVVAGGIGRTSPSMSSPAARKRRRAALGRPGRRARRLSPSAHRHP